MPDLEQKISEWRRQMFAGGVKRADVLDELESHLREDVAQRLRSGAETQAAFDAAVESIGQAIALRKEFKKVSPLKQLAARTRRSALTLAGVPNHYLETDMNTSSTNPEPGWATYLRSTAMMAPAALLWCMAAVYVLPQFNSLSAKSGFHNFPGDLLKLYRTNNALMYFFQDHFILLLSAALLALALLEWRSVRWPRYRRAILGTSAFLLNVTVLLSLFLLFIMATYVLTTQVK